MTAPLCLVTAVVCLAAALAPAAAYSVDTTTATVVRTANNGIKFENGIPILDPAPATSTEDEAAAVVLFNEDLEAAKLMEMLTEAGTDNLTAASEPRFPSGEVTIESYHSYDQLQRLAAELVTAFPNLVTKYSIGSSVQDREILALKIRPNVSSARPVGVPMVKYSGNMHGDESVGREMIIALATHLLANYGVQDRVTQLLDNTEIHLVPSMNPDGFEAVTRGNYNQVDLNRGFPGAELLGATRAELLEDREPEVAAMMQWTLDNPFVVSINFHDGAVVANYPWDQRDQRPWERSERFRGPAAVLEGLPYTGDHEDFLMLAQLYADRHATMAAGDSGCGKFAGGITNGAEWYEISGGMQDFNYLYTNCMDITLELSCVKKPLARMLQAEWEANLEPMLAYLEVAKSVLHGVVRDTSGQPVEAAHLQVVFSEDPYNSISDVGRNKDILTTEAGEYWRVLAPGSYRVKAVKGETMSTEVEVEVGDDWMSRSGPRLDLVLSQTAVRSASTTIATSTTSTTTAATTTEAEAEEEEEEEEEGTNLYILPGVCINLSLSFTPIKGCKERNNG